MKTKAFILKGRFIFLDMYNEVNISKKRIHIWSVRSSQSLVVFPQRHFKKRIKDTSDKEKQRDNTVKLGRLTDKGSLLFKRFLEQNK